MSVDILFDKLWAYYSTNNPQAQWIHDLIEQQGECIQNDHIAYRTINDPRFGVDVLARFFEQYDYRACGEYHFNHKHLFAKHYEHPDPQQPKIFISELQLECFSDQLQQKLTQCFETIPAATLDDENLLIAGCGWEPIEYTHYRALLQESEYAAWLYCFGICPNHFTVNINALDKFQDIEKLNEFLKQHDIRLNTAGGEIKGTRRDCLQQSSTLAEEVQVDFIDGRHTIPCCYYEFAKRYTNDSGQLFQGFVTQSADKIFESTDRQ